MKEGLPESPLSAAPTAPSSPSGFRLDDVGREGKADRAVKVGRAGKQNQDQDQDQDQDQAKTKEIDYFEEARMARLEMSDSDDERDEEEKRVVATVFCRNGDMHRCLGGQCPLLQLDNFGSYVCPLSGVVCGVKTVREDTSTGRMTGSANPDDIAGSASYTQKADAYEMSVKAFEEGERGRHVVAESEIFVAQKRKRKRKGEAEPKRGARCVDQEKDEHVAKATRRTADTSEQHNLLLREAEVVLDRLVSHNKRADVEEKTSDPKLADREALFAAAAGRYVKAQEAIGAPPCLSDLHDLAITCARVAAAQRAKQQADRERSGYRALLCKASVKAQVVALCVTLWLAACQTTYMKEQAKNTESFRPFIAGALYALKRGVYLATGECVVPSCPELCESLPMLRATEANSAAKGLHSASHKGLCTLHRAISSCGDKEAVERFAACINQSKAIAADVASKKFDV